MKRPASPKQGTALIVALWVLLLLSLLIGSFAYDMHIESDITSYYRKRMQSQLLALGGIELAKLTLVKSSKAKGGDDLDFSGEPNADVLYSAERLAKGGKITLVRSLGPGDMKITIYPAESRYNVNLISEEQWENLLEYTRVPEDMRDELIDAFLDWVDENDLHRLNGAESDDAFYQERGYEVKNARLDTIEELTLIKGFTDEIVFGVPGEISERSEGEEQPTGLMKHLTTWSSGCINPNAATRDTLMTLPGINDWQVDALEQYLKGEDGALGTEDDEVFESVDEAMDIGGLNENVRSFLCVSEVKIHRVDVIGKVPGAHPVRSYITSMMELDGDNVVAASWREELLP